MTTVKVLINSGKIQKINDILQNIDLILDLAVDDVIKILQKNKITASQDFFDYYTEGAKKLKNSLQNKQYLAGVKRFFSCGDVEQALNLFMRKLVSNVRNEMDTKRAKSVANQKKKFRYQAQYLDRRSDPLNLILVEEAEEIQQKNQKNEINKFEKMVVNGEIAAQKLSTGNTQLFFNL